MTHTKKQIIKGFYFYAWIWMSSTPLRRNFDFCLGLTILEYTGSQCHGCSRGLKQSTIRTPLFYGPAEFPNESLRQTGIPASRKSRDLCSTGLQEHIWVTSTERQLASIAWSAQHLELNTSLPADVRVACQTQDNVVLHDLLSQRSFLKNPSEWTWQPSELQLSQLFHKLQTVREKSRVVPSWCVQKFCHCLSVFLFVFWALSLLSQRCTYTVPRICTLNRKWNDEMGGKLGGRQNSKKSGKVPRTSGHKPLSLDVDRTHGYDGTSPP